MARDSLIIGDYDMGDDFDLEGDDDELSDLIGELIGRGRRRRRQMRRGRRAGMMTPAQAAAAARNDLLRARADEAMESRRALTAGHYVADDGMLDLYLPFEAAVTIGAAAGQTATLTVNVQRPIKPHRIIIESTDSVTRADDLQTIGVTSILVGVQPVFNAQGTAPARSFSFNAVGVRLATQVARVGQVISVQLVRNVAGANASVISGFAIGVSAEN